MLEPKCLMRCTGKTKQKTPSGEAEGFCLILDTS